MSLQGKTIFIDPGHGGTYPSASHIPNYNYGTSGAKSGPEKDSVLKIGNLVASRLRNLGAYVIMSRTSDTPISLSDRTNAANSYGADILVSLHHNGGPTSLNGISGHWYKSQDLPLAKCIIPILKNRTRLNYAYNDGYHYQNLHMTRESNMPAVLLELGFMSNVSDDTFISTDSGKQAFVNAIVEGINNYFALQPPTM